VLQEGDEILSIENEIYDATLKLEAIRKQNMRCVLVLLVSYV
jgi:hypothetical protein